MRIITCTNMNASVPSVIDPAMLMHLFQLTDSACPVGTFSFSNGLESAAAEGLVYDAATLEAFVGEVVRLSAFTDGVAALHALRSRSAEDEAGIFEADRRLLLCKLNDEARQMTCRMGRKLAELAAALGGDPLLARWLEAAVRRETPGSFPVAQGVAFAAIGADERTLFCAGQYGAANTVLGAALRCVRVTHYDTQRILYRLGGRTEALYREAAELGLDDMHAFTPQIDILAALHEKGTQRMFMN